MKTEIGCRVDPEGERKSKTYRGFSRGKSALERDPKCAMERRKGGVPQKKINLISETGNWGNKETKTSREEEGGKGASRLI